MKDSHFNTSDEDESNRSRIQSSVNQIYAVNVYEQCNILLQFLYLSKYLPATHTKCQHSLVIHVKYLSVRKVYCSEHKIFRANNFGDRWPSGLTEQSQKRLWWSKDWFAMGVWRRGKNPLMKNPARLQGRSRDAEKREDTERGLASLWPGVTSVM